MADDSCIENLSFDEIAICDQARLLRSLTWRNIELFTAMSGEINAAHVDEEFARATCSSHWRRSGGRRADREGLPGARAAATKSN